MTQPMKVALSSGVTIEIAETGGEREVAAASIVDFSPALEGIVAFGQDLTKGLARIGPDTASIEFGVKLKLDGNGLISRICGMNAESDLKIKLEWKKPS